MSGCATPEQALAPRQRLRLEVTGAVQGVGFRPFVHRLAVSEGLAGFVQNSGAGASVEIEGPAPALERFLGRIEAELAPPGRIRTRRCRELPVRHEQAFSIAPSTREGAHSALVLPDQATCPECLREIFDPGDRRHRYAFTSCVKCGPRYSIIAALPYDRARTSMGRFAMCPACRREYEDPSSRRFHAETNACPDCGPQAAFWDAGGNPIAVRHEAVRTAAEWLRDGRIVALKGLGGFQLLVDARNEAAVFRLRERKQRPAKPFAVMVAGRAEALCLAHASAAEIDLLCSAAAPIVILRARAPSGAIAQNVAPGNPRLGLMLPPTPLHHLLMEELKFPIIATSGNRGDEPIVADEAQALERLAGLADGFLIHDRPIVNPVDDSVVQVLLERETVLRCARGYAPRAFEHPAATTPVLALGGHEKSALALALERQLILGPHIGDLEATGARTAFGRAVESLLSLHEAAPALIACDRHPGYHSTRFAAGLGLPVERVPHHLAHALAGMVDEGLEGPVLAVAWDGTGHGRDGTVWGGEFLAVDRTSYRRVAHLLTFRLPGGEAAVREPRRSALGALAAIFGRDALSMTDLSPVAAFSAAERQVLWRMLERGVNAPLTSSAGRLFDAVAAILDLRQRASFEAEAAMAVEFAADAAEGERPGPKVSIEEGRTCILDWRALVSWLTDGHRRRIPAGELAAAFHEALAEAIVETARRAGIGQVLLTGGCFQNARLTERAVGRLRAAGFAAYWHGRVPPNDGGLALGQAAFALQPRFEAAL